jgi:hypothetical protein
VLEAASDWLMSRAIRRKTADQHRGRIIFGFSVFEGIEKESG